ncbi:MAG TPA: OmpH family outer membrane protein [bacterium]|jgi:outer membrane protein|nr:OmpH family outer membrane protein [bacterium]
MRFITLLCCFLIASVVSAKDFRFATVDMQKLFNSFPGTEKAKQKLSDLEEKKKEDLADSKQELIDLQKELGGDSSLFTEKQKLKKEKEYNDKLAAYNQATEEVQKELMAEESEMTQNIVDQIKAIVADVAKDKGVDLVLDSDKTVYAKDPVDLTSDVLDSYKKISDTDSKDDSGSKK